MQVNGSVVLISGASEGIGCACAAALRRRGVRRLFDVNVFAALALAQLVAPVLRRNHAGFIVNIGSVGGKVSLPWAAIYCASKFALHAINDSLRRELSTDDKVCPGIVETHFREHVLSGGAPDPVSDIRRTVSPASVAEEVVRGIERGSRTVYVPRSGKLFTSLDELSSRTMELAPCPEMEKVGYTTHGGPPSLGRGL